MFHEGDLQSGIVRAVQESKSVVCFVTDDNEEGRQWEQWLGEEALAAHIQQQAVALRLQAGSQEAGFLAAFCPVSSTPALVVIYQGQLREQLNSGSTKDEFTARVLRAIEQDNSTATAQNPTEVALLPGETAETATPTSEPTVTTPIQQQQIPPMRQEPSPRIQSLLQERGQRLEAMRLAREQAEKAAAAERTKARKQKEAEEVAAKPSSSSASSIGKDRGYEAEQAKRKREAKADRERILKQIENDKIARREKEERRRAAAKAVQDGESGEAPQSAMPARTTTVTSGTTCALQVRLPSDGSVRKTFPAAATIAKDVRAWLALEADADTKNTAYTFKLIQTPQPSRSISDAEEAQTLQDLGLLPSATLIMVHTPGTIATAYPGAAVGGLSGIIRKVINLILAAIMWIVDALRTFAGPRPTVPSSATSEGRSTVGVAGGPFRSGAIEAAIARRQEREDAAAASKSTNASSGGTTSSSSTAAVGGTTGIRIRTLRDQVDERENRQFYNGNQLSFEPRKDDEESESRASST